MISFDPLLDFLHFNKLNLQDVSKDVGLSSRTVAKFRKGESVSLATIDKICQYYRLPIERVVEIKLDEPKRDSDNQAD